MMRSLVFAAGLLVAGSACAQYKWTDQNGRVQYSDTPPAGVNAAPMRQRSAPPPRVESSDSKDDAKDAKDDAKDAKKGPLTPAEQDAGVGGEEENVVEGQRLLNHPHENSFTQSGIIREGLWSPCLTPPVKADSVGAP